MDKKDQNSKIAITEEILKELLSLLEIKITPRVEEKEGFIYVQLPIDNPGILIGYHGQTLASLQMLLNMMVYRKLGEWVKIVVDVGDYRVRRQETLEKMALSAAQKVKFANEEYAFPPMNGADRRIIHMALADNPDVTTESQGEGYDRRVVVKPR